MLTEFDKLEREYKRLMVIRHKWGENHSKMCAKERKLPMTKEELKSFNLRKAKEFYITMGNINSKIADVLSKIEKLESKLFFSIGDFKFGLN